MRALLPTLFGVALALAPQSSAHDGPAPSAIHAHDLPEALRLAESDSRLVLLHVSANERLGLPLLRWPDEHSWEALEPILRESVVVDTLAGTAGLPGGPGTYLLSSDGQVLWRGLADVRLIPLIHATREWFQGEAPLERAQAALTKRGASDFLSRERMAGALALAGRIDDAFEHGMWCLAQGQARTSHAAVARRGIVLVGLAHMAQGRGALTAQLLVERDRMASEALAQDDPSLALDVAHLDAAMSQSSRTVATYRSTERGSRVRLALLDAVFDLLLEEGDHQALADVVPALEAFQGEVALTRRTQAARPATARYGTGRGTEAFTLKRGAGLVEILAATGKSTEAAELMDSYLDFERSERSIATLRLAVERAGSPLAELALAERVGQ